MKVVRDLRVGGTHERELEVEASALLGLEKLERRPETVLSLLGRDSEIAGACSQAHPKAAKMQSPKTIRVS